MSENKTESLVVQEKGQLVKKHKMTEDAFVPKIKVKMTDGSVIVVPRDADANKNQSIILAEAARNFVAEQIRLFSQKGRVLTPQELKELVTAAKLVNDMSIVAHEDIFVPSDKPGKPGGAATKDILKTVEAAMKGAMSGNAEATQKNIDKFMKLGKKEKQAESIDIVATEVK